MTEGCHVAVIARGTPLPVLQLFVRCARVDGFNGRMLLLGSRNAGRWWWLGEAWHEGLGDRAGRLGRLHLVGGVGFRGDEAGVDVFVVGVGTRLITAVTWDVGLRL